WGGEERMYVSRGVKASAISAACGPYIMSCGMSDSTIAMNTADGIAVSNMPKYGNANSPQTTVPIRYIFLRPIRSEMWPKSGMEMNETHEATVTAGRVKTRGLG